ncbi:hypothetical protein [Marinobacter arenosus]|uniref:hypothetical protein n=1 Tax=Marinobacter arenosus TaxID=2856822 RepID=UPI001C4ADC6B|nr:hypothetical protein [Marinobacter arenosus]MBW0149567.1 hypothetical protein [Marinobacter arenosus]
MAGCVLRMQGLQKELPDCFVISGQSAKSVVLEISDADKSFQQQLKDSLGFVQGNFEELEAVKKENPNLKWGLDFGVWLKIQLTQSFAFPSQLVNLAGSLGMDLEVSIYAASDS